MTLTEARANGISIAYQVSGPAGGAPLLLIHGVGAQLIRWPPAFIDALAAAGFRVIRYDSRDIGLSTHMDEAPIPDLAAVTAAQARGELADLPYTLSDLAADAAGLLEALGIDRAHVLGVSLGGMVAQVLAIEHRSRVASLAVVMSHSGNPELPPSAPAALKALATRPPNPSEDREGYLQTAVALNAAVGSPAYPTDEAVIRDFAWRAAQRAFYPQGAARQLAASRGAPDRRPGLRTLDAPTLIIHGADDLLVPAAGGEDLARNIPGAWLLMVNGMGHDLPDALVELFVGAVKANSGRRPA